MKSKPCKVCNHKEVVVINEELLAGTPIPLVCEQHKITEPVLWLHSKACLKKESPIETTTGTIEPIPIDLDKLVIEEIISTYRFCVDRDMQRFRENEIESPTAVLKDYITVLEYYRKTMK